MTNNTDLLAAINAIPLEIERTRAEIGMGLQSFSGSIALQGSRSVPVTRSLVWGGSGRLVGWSLACVGATAAIVVLRDGRTRDGDPLAAITIPVGTDKHAHFGAAGVSFVEGLFLEVVAGTGVTGGSLGSPVTPGTTTASWNPAQAVFGAVHLGEVD